MSNYPTEHTNVRTPVDLIASVKADHANYNGHAKDALSGYVKDLQLDRITEAERQYLTYQGEMPSDLRAYCANKTRLHTYRLRQLDLDYLRLSGYSISRAINLALLKSLNLGKS